MAEAKKVDMSFWDHLRELINRLRIIIYALIISTIVVMVVPVSFDLSSFFSANPFYLTITSYVIINFQERFLPPDAQLLPLSPTAPLEVYMFISVILGVVLSMPVISYELYKFLNPALYKRERKAVAQFVAAFAGLFIFGFALGYFYIVPLTMRMLFLFANLLHLPPLYDFTEFFSLIGLSLFLCGLIFTFPTYIVLLVKVGILETNRLTKNRKYLYGGILILIAFLDPDPGLVTEALVFVPVIILMEASILIAKRIEKAREAN
ncbi:preprotein translocase subunit TatC [Candidatus Bathyarchaeota archaeon]|nr:preprotein translocase subunit TatC [Candidatus Bathyarchaeota archaeon]